MNVSVASKTWITNYLLVAIRKQNTCVRLLTIQELSKLFEKQYIKIVSISFSVFIYTNPRTKFHNTITLLTI